MRRPRGWRGARSQGTAPPSGAGGERKGRGDHPPGRRAALESSRGPKIPQERLSLRPAGEVGVLSTGRGATTSQNGATSDGGPHTGGGAAHLRSYLSGAGGGGARLPDGGETKRLRPALGCRAPSMARTILHAVPDPGLPAPSAGREDGTCCPRPAAPRQAPQPVARRSAAAAAPAGWEAPC